MTVRDLFFCVDKRGSGDLVYTVPNPVALNTSMFYRLMVTNGSRVVLHGYADLNIYGSHTDNAGSTWRLMRSPRNGLTWDGTQWDCYVTTMNICNGNFVIAPTGLGRSGTINYGSASISASGTYPAISESYAIIPVGICWNGTYYYVINGSGLLYKTSDASNWTSAGDSGIGSLDLLFGHQTFEFFNGVFIVRKDSNNLSYFSTDLSTWTTPLDAGYSVLWLNNQWVASKATVTTVKTSTDAITWTTVSTNTVDNLAASIQVKVLAYAGGYYWGWDTVAKTLNLHYSTDLITWTPTSAVEYVGSDLRTNDMCAVGLSNGKVMTLTDWGIYTFESTSVCVTIGRNINPILNTYAGRIFGINDSGIIDYSRKMTPCGEAYKQTFNYGFSFNFQNPAYYSVYVGNKGSFLYAKNNTTAWIPSSFTESDYTFSTLTTQDFVAFVRSEVSTTEDLRRLGFITSNGQVYSGSSYLALIINLNMVVNYAIYVPITNFGVVVLGDGNVFYTTSNNIQIEDMSWTARTLPIASDVKLQTCAPNEANNGMYIFGIGSDGKGVCVHVSSTFTYTVCPGFGEAITLDYASDRISQAIHLRNKLNEVDVWVFTITRFNYGFWNQGHLTYYMYGSIRDSVTENGKSQYWKVLDWYQINGLKGARLYNNAIKPAGGQLEIMFDNSSSQTALLTFG